MTFDARLRAYAKVNLGLRVLYKRPDGYHELRTVFQTTSLADEITLYVTPSRTTKVEVIGAPEIPDNLAVRAAHLILESLKIHADIRISLKKHIPMGAGLGGGSADAAAMLLALPALLRKRLPADRLAAIALQLGSDVPFFLHGGTALGLGRGEELYPLPDFTAANVLLVAPPVHSSTAEAYNDLSPQLTSIELQNKLVSFQKEIWQAACPEARVEKSFRLDGNDFEAVVFSRHPELRRIKQRLLRLGAVAAAMSGSGSSVFGIFPDRRTLGSARKSFEQKPSLANERVFPISFLSRAQYRSRWRRALTPYIEPEKWPPQSPYAR